MNLDLEKHLQEQQKELVTLLESKKEESKSYTDSVVKENVDKLVNDIVDLKEKELKETRERLSKLELAAQKASGDPEEPKVSSEEESKFWNEFCRKNGQEDVNIALKALQAGSNPDGGYLDRPNFSNFINQRVFETSPVRQYATVVTVPNGSSLTFLDDTDEASTGGWVSETATRSETNTPTLGEITIDTHEQYALAKSTQKLLNVAFLDAEGWLRGKLADKFLRYENTAFITGDGVGKPKGLLAGGYTFTTSYSGYTKGTIEMVNSGANGTWTVAGFLDLIYSLKPGYQGRLYLNRNSFADILKLNAATTYHMWNPQALFFGSADGRVGPTVPVEFFNDITASDGSTAGIKGAIFGDLSYYHILDGQSLNILRDPYSYKPYVGFYATKFVGAGLINFEAVKVQQLSA